MNEYLKEYIELQKQFRETKGNPDSVRALYTFKENALPLGWHKLRSFLAAKW